MFSSTVCYVGFVAVCLVLSTAATDEQCATKVTPSTLRPGNGMALIQKKQQPAPDKGSIQAQLKETARILDETASEIGLHVEPQEVPIVLDEATWPQDAQDGHEKDDEALLQEEGWESEPDPFEGGVLVSSTDTLSKSSCDCHLRINGHNKTDKTIVCELDGKLVATCGGFEKGKEKDTTFVEHDDYDEGHCKCTFVHNSLSGEQRRTCKRDGQPVDSCSKFGIRDKVDVTAEEKVKCVCVIRVNSLSGRKTRACKVGKEAVPNCDKFSKVRKKGDQVTMRQCQCMMFRDVAGKQHKDCLSSGKKVPSCDDVLNK